MVSECKLLKKFPLHIQELNYEKTFMWWKIMLGRWPKFELVAKTSAHKKNSFCNFSKSLVKNHLNWIRVSLCPIVVPWWGKTKHHRGNKKRKCQVATSQGFYVNLSNGKQNVTCTSQHKIVRMWLYNQGQWKPKWNDPRTSNVKTQAQTNVGKVGTKDGIELRWS
jgi:hypothetical protein